VLLDVLVFVRVCGSVERSENEDAEITVLAMLRGASNRTKIRTKPRALGLFSLVRVLFISFLLKPFLPREKSTTKPGHGYFPRGKTPYSRYLPEKVMGGVGLQIPRYSTKMST